MSEIEEIKKFIKEVEEEAVEKFIKKVWELFPEKSRINFPAPRAMAFFGSVRPDEVLQVLDETITYSQENVSNLLDKLRSCR